MSNDSAGFDADRPESEVDPEVKHAEEAAAGPAEEDDPGNDSIASTAAVE